MTVPRMSEDKLPRVTKEELKVQMYELASIYGYPGTPGNETGFSKTYTDIWWEVFSPYTCKQIKKAVSAHINADDSLKGVFPLPGRIKKFITKDEDESRLFHEQIDREQKALEEKRKREEEERWNSLSKEEQEAELKAKEESRRKIQELLREKGLIDG